MTNPSVIISASEFPTYINIGTVSGTLPVSGIVLNGQTALFAVAIPVSNQNNRADIYATNLNTNTKELISSTNYFAIYQAISFEYPTFTIIYQPTSILFTLFVNNFSGADITLINQTYTIDVVQYQIPF